jgi:gamma-glutamyltranspeptidase/glutathione hydrolase
LLMVSDSPAEQPQRTAGEASLAGRSAVYAPRGVIATSQPLASAAGLAVLERGGNAIDAAVTAAVVLNLVEPFMTGMGGDVFAIIWSAREQRLIGLNSSGRAGARMTREELLRRGHKEMPITGPESITVPGALAGWAALLERYGTISLAQALEPAIRLAEEGFPVSPIIARQWAAYSDIITRDEGARAVYLVGGQRAPRAGEWHRNPDFARSLRLVASKGPGALYGGELGRRIVEHLDKLGGFLTLDDLQRHRADWVEPISADFRGYRLWELPPNGQGIAALEMLRILEPFDLKAMGHNSAPYLHHLIEAKKLAFADLARYVADPDHMTVRAERLLAEDFIRERRARLNPQRAAEHVEPGPAVTASETIYLAAADAEGNMVSFINSLAGAFGSGVAVPGTGFALQNRGAGFTLESGHPNTVLLNLLVFGMDIQQAIDAPRFRHLSGLRVGLEAPIAEAVRNQLAALGHNVVELHPDNAGGGQAVLRLERGWAAGSDPRKDGAAIGH